MAPAWTDLLLLFLTFFSFVYSEEQTNCPPNNQCVPLSECKIVDPDFVFYVCHSGLNMICCPKGQFSSNIATLQNRKTALFPVNCGVVLTSDKISGGKKADLGQFPWMALLGYRQRGVPFTQYLCGGSIITEFYVMTAAHCINLERRLELMEVRFGEHDLATNKDCTRDVDNVESCADPPIDIPVERTIIHSQYDTRTLKNDIALVKVRQKITFSDFVRPICLPFERNLENRDLSKQKLIVSGWGKTNAANVAGSNSLLFAVVTVWNHGNCATKVPPEVRPITRSQLCANGPTKEDACRGDSGGPLINATVDGDGELRYCQLGVVSFASTLTCGDPTLPTVYTRVDKYLKWVEKNVV